MTTAELEARLAAAEDAYHRLMIGTSAVEFRDQNGELVRYTPAQSTKLAAYIMSLKSQLGSGAGSQPPRVYF